MPYGGYNNMNWNYNNPIVQTPTSMPNNNWLQNQSQQPIKITEVQGKEGAQAFLLPPSSSILLLDKTDAVVWLKRTDDGGYATLNKFFITPAEEVEQAQKENQYNALETRLTNIESQYRHLQEQYAQIEEKLNNGKSNTSSYAKSNANSNSKQQQ